MNVLMISIGDTILSNPNLANAFQRQQEYAKRLGHIDMIVFSLKKHNLKRLDSKYISIYPSKSLNMFTFVYDVLKIADEIIKTKKIDVITTQDPFGTALAGYFLKRKYKIPLHIQNHSSFLDNKEWIKEKPLLFTIFNRLSYFTIKQANRLRVVNSKEKQKYIDILGIDKNKIDIAPLPIDTEFWQTKPNQEDIDIFLKKYNIDKNMQILSWAGRFVKVKNLEYLFKSVSLVNKKKSVEFILAGDFKNSYIDLKYLEKKYNLKPKYLGVLDTDELKIMYYLTTLYLHTSNYEGFGVVVADAQASGSVVVSRNTAGTSDIIENKKSGILVDGDEDIFSKEVLELLDNHNRLIEFSNYAKNMMKNRFNKEEMFNNIVKSIKKAID